MTVAFGHHDAPSLSDRLRNAQGMTGPLMRDIIDRACRRIPSLGQSERTARLMQLIDAEAWTDAALALTELELPLWHVRRIAYDEGEWHCALSRERELPDCRRRMPRRPCDRTDVGFRGSPGIGRGSLAAERPQRAPCLGPAL